MQTSAPRTDHEDLLLQTLQQRFSLEQFRPGQREVIEAVLAGRSLLAVMPTGSGKSLCYQLPALLADAPTLVVSPLIALMQDQAEAARSLGMKATFINSHVSPDERTRRLAAACRGAYQLLYLAPERLAAPGFLQQLRRARWQTMVVDEAHCVSVWGHDFRPEYRQLPAACEQLGIQQVCAFTATATPEVRRDIIRCLRLSRTQRPDLFVHGFARDNLTFRVEPIKHLSDKTTAIAPRLQRLPGGSAIIYAATRKNAEQIATELGGQKLGVGIYHAGLTEMERSTVQQRFMSGDLRVIVATNAFGMGINKPDIRLVVHHDLPGSLEAYYQEAGRAGRDGQPAECVLLFSYADVRIHDFFIDKTGENNGERGGRVCPSAAHVKQLKQLQRAKLRHMLRYCYAETCRHELILRYFGDHSGNRGCSDRCDNCLGKRTTACVGATGHGAHEVNGPRRRGTITKPSK